jgi:hypothetical protein
MPSNLLRLSVVIAALSPLSFGQAGAVAGHELPLLGIVGGGILAGGVFSVLKLRHHK